MTYKFEWLDSELDDIGATGAQVVIFAGGLQVCVLNLTKNYKPCARWRVSFSAKESPFPELRKLFDSRADAKRAVERVLGPVVAVAPKIVRARVEATLET